MATQGWAGKMWQRAYWLVPMLACSMVWAGEVGMAPSRAATLENDITGPAVDWVGSVAEVLRDGDDTCFVLNRTTGEAGVPAAFMACAFGSYESAAFAAGRKLQVQGRLGVAMPRLVAGRVVALHLVVSARISPALEPMPDDWPYPYGFGLGFGYCDPFWHPWPYHHHCWP